VPTSWMSRSYTPLPPPSPYMWDYFTFMLIMFLYIQHVWRCWCELKWLLTSCWHTLLLAFKYRNGGSAQWASERIANSYTLRMRKEKVACVCLTPAHLQRSEKNHVFLDYGLNHVMNMYIRSL
jgi:hypothetical protein